MSYQAKGEEMVKRTLAILFMAVLLVSLLLGCGGGEETPAAIKLVPEKADMIGLVDLSQIMEDEDIAGLWEAMPLEPDMPQTLDEALDLAREEIGLELSDFREGLIFGEISEATGDMDYFGIVVKGTFDEIELTESMESLLDEVLTTISYKGCEIYTGSDEEAGLAVLGSDAFVIGPIEAVKDVIAVREGDQSAVSGKVLTAYNGLGDALVKVAMIVPPEAIEEGLQALAGQLPIELPGLDALADLDTVGMALTKEEQSIALDLELCFTNSESAEGADTLIHLAILMAGALPDVPEEALELLEKLDVSISGSCLDVTLEMTMSELGALITNITNIVGETMGGGGA
jgi:hypothetical protein